MPGILEDACRRRRRGFLFTMPLMLGMGILVFASMIAISQLFVTVGGPMVPDLLAGMPTIFHYAEDGTRIPQYMPVFATDESTVAVSVNNGTATMTEAEFAEAFPALATYSLMTKIALGIFVILLMLAGLSYFFEEFNLVRQGTAYNIIAKMIVLVSIYFVLPYLWDMVALVIESSALYLMDPFGGDPHGRTTELWCMMGSVTCTIDGNTEIGPVELFGDIGEFDRESALSQDAWNNALQTPFFGEEFVINVLLGLFKGFAVMFMTAMMFILSAIRVLLTEVIIISFPLVSAIGLIPWINTGRISEMFQQNLIGLAMAPIMSALVLSVGLAAIDSQNLPPLRMWFQLLSVGFLAVFFPVMLAPMLGNISTRVGGMIQSSMTSASVGGSAGLKGATRGISGASSAIHAAGAAGGGMAAAMGGAASPQRGSFPSSDVGTATSGANLAGGISLAEKARMYGRAGAAGMIGGLGSGLLQGAAQGIGAGAAVSGISKEMMREGAAGAAVIAGETAGRHAARVGASRMLEGTDREPDIPHLESGTMMNPGYGLDIMMENSADFDAGRRLAEDAGARGEFLAMYGKSLGVPDAGREAVGHFEREMTEQIQKSPIAAGRIYRSLASGGQESPA